ncbi:MAG: bacterio-opsin activator domain-containing protein [Halobacterium sp.]
MRSEKRDSGQGSGAVQGRPRVLVVDDDEDLADTYAHWLRDDYDVQTAYSGEEALDVISPEVDIVLLDRRMPRTPGDEILDEIRERELNCAVGMLTAVKPDSDIVDLPFDEYLVKPITRQELLEAVDDLSFRDMLDEDARDYLAMSSTREALSARDAEKIGDDDAVTELGEWVEAHGEDPRVQSQIEELRQLKRINRIIRSIDQGLVGASSREDIERKVVDRLVADGPFRVALLGDYVDSFGDVTFSVANGDTSVEDPEDLSLDVSGTAVGDDFTDGEVRVFDLSGEPPAPIERLADEAADGFHPESVVLVPIVYQNTVYGVIALFPAADYELTESVRSVLTELGATIANAMQAAETRRLMHADNVVEVEFTWSDRASPLVDVSASLSGDVSLDGFVPASDDAITCYLTVRNATGDDASELLASHDAVDSFRIIEDYGDALQLEATLTGTSMVHLLVGAGADVRSLSVSEGSGSVTGVVAPGTSVRNVMESVADEFDDVDLVAKREREQSRRLSDGFRSDLADELTDKQHEVVEAMYNGGYFEWPRESTAEEIAEAIDVAPPTLHEHLREAERKLIATYLEDAEST